MLERVASFSVLRRRLDIAGGEPYCRKHRAPLFTERIATPFVDARRCYHGVVEKPQGSWIPNAALQEKGRGGTIFPISCIRYAKSVI